MSTKNVWIIELFYDYPYKHWQFEYAFPSRREARDYSRDHKRMHSNDTLRTRKFVKAPNCAF